MFLFEDKLFAIKFFTVSAVGPSRKGKTLSRFNIFADVLARFLLYLS